MGASTAGPVRSAEFAETAEPYRRELLALCYRMLGSADEAEDLVQETYLRAWRSYEEFEGRASMRTWLYRIATNVCLTALERRGRRVLASGLGPPGSELDDEGALWLSPLPTPEAVVTEREGLRLALVAALQFLPARQRAVLILREVLGFHAGEVAAMLDTSTAAVKSSLQRARARLDGVLPEPPPEPTEARARELLEQYMAAFENSDPAALERVLIKDAALDLAPSRTWYDGVESCMAYLRTVMGSPGEWQMTPASFNGQPGATVLYRGEPFGVAVLTVAAAGIARITVFT
ncbi:MAG: RNA polymerase subunit sigma-70 [Nonomuraea sp.]|nr:RNA polymerase subunit sigma-70 [Nonomuraea sp.]